MSDLIRREDLIKVFESHGLAWKDLKTIMPILKEVDAIPSAEPEPQWIPVSEALPKVNEKALCTDGNAMMVGTYTRYGWGFPCYFPEPIAWMPLPEPWRGKK